MTTETNEVPDLPEGLTPPAPAAEESSKAHPAWDSLLSEIPEAWHSKVTPFLQESDRNYQKQLEKYTAFKEYVDQGVTPELITGGLNLARAIENNPAEVFTSLRDYLSDNGMLPEEAAQAAADIMENQSGQDAEDIFDEVPAALKKELDELKQFKTQQEQRVYEQDLAKATEVAAQELDRDMGNLKTQYQISEAHEIAIYDLMNAALNAGREMSVADAAQQLQAMIGGFQPMNGQPVSSAPTVVGSAGGGGVPAPDLSVPRDEKGKREMLAKMFEQYTNAAR
jgi:hypothetical protein